MHRGQPPWQQQTVPAADSGSGGQWQQQWRACSSARRSESARERVRVYFSTTSLKEDESLAPTTALGVKGQSVVKATKASMPKLWHGCELLAALWPVGSWGPGRQCTAPGPENS